MRPWLLLLPLAGCLWIDDEMHDRRVGGVDTDPAVDTDTDAPVEVDGDGDGVSATDDCDDADPDRYPGNTELCGDDVDSDCDGVDAAGHVTLEAGGVLTAHASLQAALDASEGKAEPIVRLCGGTHQGPFTIDFPVEVVGWEAVATLEASTGSVVTINGGATSAGPPQAEAITLRNLLVRGGAAEGGGGIDGKGDPLSIVDCEITGNTAEQQGGGMRLAGNVTLEGLDVHGNTGAQGGGMALMMGVFTVTDTSVYSNEATLFGGGVAVVASKATLDRTIVDRNTSPLGSGLAVVHVAGLPPELTATEVIGGEVRNNSGPGAAVLVDSPEPAASIVVSGLLVRDHKFTGDGGGIYVQGDSGSVRLDGVTVTSNTAANGAGIYDAFGGALVLDGVSLTANTASAGGGGLYVADGTVSFHGDVVDDNAAADGDGVRVGAAGTFRVCGAIGVLDEVANSDGAMPSLGAACSTTAGSGAVGSASACDCPD